MIVPGPGLGVLSPSDLTAFQPGTALDTELHYVEETARSQAVGSGRQGQRWPPEGTGRGQEAGWVAGAGGWWALVPGPAFSNLSAPACC